MWPDQQINSFLTYWGIPFTHVMLFDQWLILFLDIGDFLTETEALIRSQYDVLRSQSKSDIKSRTTAKLYSICHTLYIQFFYRNELALTAFHRYHNIKSVTICSQSGCLRMKCNIFKITTSFTTTSQPQLIKSCICMLLVLVPNLPPPQSHMCPLQSSVWWCINIIQFTK